MKQNYVIGDPVAHSISPLIHNIAYKFLGIEKEYSFAKKHVKSEDLGKFLKDFEQKWHGLAVTIPHKQAVVTLIDKLDEPAREIGAVNTVLNKKGLLMGYNTDWVGASKALEQKVDVSGKTVAILGTGGTARAVAYAVKKAGGELVIFGRNEQKIIKIAKDFGAMPAHIDVKHEIASCEVIINATSVGLSEKTEVELLPLHLFNSYHTVFDVVYGRETKFIANAKKAGATTIDGREMLIEQAVPQINILTGKEISSKDLRNALAGKI